MTNELQSKLSAGSQDTEFGTNGNAFISFDGYGTEIRGITAVANEEKRESIYFAGIAAIHGSAYGMGCLKPDGHPDLRFHQDGQLTGLVPGSPLAWGSQVSGLPNGKLLLLGDARDRRLMRSPFLARFSRDGTLDPEFGDKGIVFLDVDLDLDLDLYPSASLTSPIEADPSDSSAQASGNAILLPDGKIIVHRTYFGSGGRDVGMIFRLTAKGELDSSFNQSGYIVVTPDKAEGSRTVLSNLIVQSDGKYLACGSFAKDKSPTGKMVFFRCLDNGNVDTDFGDRGFVFVDNRVPTTREFFSQVIEDPKQKRLLGIGVPLTADYGIICAIDYAGKPDKRFNGGAPLYTQLDNLSTRWVAGALQQDGKLIVAGSAKRHSDSADHNVVVARITHDGTLDNTFGHEKGWVFPPIQEAMGHAFSVAIQADGKILIGGRVANRGFVTRLLGDPS